MSWKRPSLLALFIASMACWLERQAASQIEYLKAENRALRSRLGRRRILFSNAERRTLGSLAKEVGRKALRDLDSIVCPATLLRWHREFVARKRQVLPLILQFTHTICPVFLGADPPISVQVYLTERHWRLFSRV